MTRQQAIQAAQPDALQFRWAVRRTPLRTYLARADAHGRIATQTTLATKPQAPTCGWEPLAPVIKEEAECP